MPKHLVSQKELSEYLLFLFTERFADGTHRVKSLEYSCQRGEDCVAHLQLVCHTFAKTKYAPKSKWNFSLLTTFFFLLWKSVWMLTVLNSQEDGCRIYRIWRTLKCEMDFTLRWNPSDDKLMSRNLYLFAIHGFWFWRFHSKSYNPAAKKSNTNSDRTCVRRSWDIFFFITSNKLNISSSSSSQRQ